MRALLDDLPAVEHNDAVREANGGKAMSNDQGRASGHSALQRLKDEALGSRVQAGSWLIEDHDGGVAQHRSRDGYPLFLAAGEGGRALGYNCVVTIGEAVDEFVGVRDSRRRSDLIVAGPGASEGDVFPDRSAEK